MRAWPVLLSVLALTPTGSWAGEPRGFEAVPFGTPRVALVVDEAFRAHCHPAPETLTTIRTEAWRVTCPTYDLSHFGPLRVAFLFDDGDRLAGYVVYIPQEHQRQMRAKLESLYGSPSRELERGQTLLWDWPSGTEASLTIFCLGSDGCLTVKTKSP